MSTPTVSSVVQLRRPRTRPTPGRQLAEELRAALAKGHTIVWPSARYRPDPCAFAEEVLGIKLWSKQRDILEAIRDHKRVSVRSGHKVSKSNTAAIAAIWFYSSFDDARVVLSSTTARQVDAILWREVRKLISKAKFSIDGDLHELARSGLKADDFREIVGFTAKEAEAVAGVSGANLLYLLDEASGIPDPIYEAIEGNRAGGARLALFSNPTRTEGEFYRSHTEKSDFYFCIQVSSEETPNVLEGRNVIPGLATREWIDEKKAEWGEDSPLYKIRVRGEFVVAEDGKIISVHAIGEAEQRWADTPEDGRLHVGIDPAGPGQAGDESVFAVRRGYKVVRLVALRGLTEEAHLAHLRGLLREHRKPREPVPVVSLDREGPIGSNILGLFRAHLSAHLDDFALVAVRSSDRATREPFSYDRVRDELWASLAQWIRDGGAIPPDTRLSRELHAPEWIGQVTGKLKATPKDELRKVLGRSPDRADAVALAVWTPIAFDERRDAPEPPEPPPMLDAYSGLDAINPYATMSPWGAR